VGVLGVEDPMQLAALGGSLDEVRTGREIARAPPPAFTQNMLRIPLPREFFLQRVEAGIHVRLDVPPQSRCVGYHPADTHTGVCVDGRDSGFDSQKRALLDGPRLGCAGGRSRLDRHTHSLGHLWDGLGDRGG